MIVEAWTQMQSISVQPIRWNPQILRKTRLHFWSNSDSRYQISVSLFVYISEHKAARKGRREGTELDRDAKSKKNKQGWLIQVSKSRLQEQMCFIYLHTCCCHRLCVTNRHKRQQNVKQERMHNRTCCCGKVINRGGVKQKAESLWGLSTRS